ncbi:GNAT family N-acetyltransferase [Halocatena pleomorpha]|uniref:GNAT family N-acetyltransferase n=1 Tax=Halocatena pleomorpha TaxID=1785090 RepID=A0A3P3RGT7_9EURY|nr:GNAT family N-acetyltransferase [Halocatena pleomorpha]RRJ32662.1 GNAT family N-acetyltransferase [Halocatena pleomorpha]
MYVRDAKNRDEVWLLDHIEEMELDETTFRSRDYVIAIDEQTNEKAGFGRIRLHKTGAETERSPSGQGEGGEICELTSIGVLDHWRRQGVGAHVVERLVETATDQGYETVYSLTDEPRYLAQFGFEAIETDELPTVLQHRLSEKRESLAPEAVPMAIDSGAFEMPTRLRERFKHASEQVPEDEPEETPEDFGIDSESATYKYDI